MRLEGGFKRGGRISGRVFEANCSKQMGQRKKKTFTKCFCVYTRGDKGSCVERELVTRVERIPKSESAQKVDPREQNSSAAAAGTRTRDLLIPTSVH